MYLTFARRMVLTVHVDRAGHEGKPEYVECGPGRTLKIKTRPQRLSAAEFMAHLGRGRIAELPDNGWTAYRADGRIVTVDWEADAKLFCFVWVRSHSLAEAARRLHTDPDDVLSRVRRLRRLGVNLGTAPGGSGVGRFLTPAPAGVPMLVDADGKLWPLGAE